MRNGTILEIQASDQRPLVLAPTNYFSFSEMYLKKELLNRSNPRGFEKPNWRHRLLNREFGRRNPPKAPYSHPVLSSGSDIQPKPSCGKRQIDFVNATLRFDAEKSRQTDQNQGSTGRLDDQPLTCGQRQDSYALSFGEFIHSELLCPIAVVGVIV